MYHLLATACIYSSTCIFFSNFCEMFQCFILFWLRLFETTKCLFNISWEESRRRCAHLMCESPFHPRMVWDALGQENPRTMKSVTGMIALQLQRTSASLLRTDTVILFEACPSPGLTVSHRSPFCMVWDIWTSIAIAYDMAIALDRSHFSGGICDCSRIRWWLLWMPSILRSHRPHGKWTCFGDYSFQQAQLRTGNILRYSLKFNFEVW